MQLSVHTWMQELHELQACSTPLSHLGSSHQHSPNYLRCLLNYIERTKDDNTRISLATCHLPLATCHLPLVTCSVPVFTKTMR